MDQTPMDVTASTQKEISRDRPQDSSARHSPAPPLAPLEFLQNQRRGSITDPSLHAASPSSQHSAMLSSSPGAPAPSSYRQQGQDLLLAQAHPFSRQLESLPKGTSRAARPTSPFIFGDASAQPTALSKSSIRLHTNTQGERGKSGAPIIPTPFSYKAHVVTGEMFHAQNGQRANRAGDEMDTDSDERQSAHTARHPPNFDYSRRRHSVPEGMQVGIGHPRGGPVSPSRAGAKRKMSSDRAQLPAVGEEMDPKLSGPGVRSSIAIDPEEPASKRRSSAFDTQRIAQMSLYDRRDSIDSRMSGGTSTSTWWPNDNRRDSSSSIFSGTSMNSGFNSPALPGDVHGRQPSSMSAFTWASNAGPSDSSAPSGMQASPVDPSLSRQLENPVPPHSTIPPNNMPVDRRMSAPDTMPSSSTTRPDRGLRSRSRPPSRSTATAARASVAPPSPELSPSSARPEESPTSSVSLSQGSAPPMSSTKETGSTPYSRSPELRVSHKLAERKRRKEMRDLFDELRDHLPADRGMKASKWEILSKAIDFIQQLKQSQQDMSREIDVLRHEVETVRHGVPYGHPGAPHAVMYPPPNAGHYGPPNSQPPHAPHLSHPPQSQQSLSRPGSSHNSYAPGPGSGPPPVANGKTQSQAPAL
ncbi:hypothetical protein M0805_007433 [Coniferiporia weirii]|nr:hypothetical protein M0805_007433 [Coniferiporia weirii]